MTNVLRFGLLVLLSLLIASCGASRSNRGIDVLDITYTDPDNAQIKLIDPGTGDIRLLQVGDNVDGSRILRASPTSITLIDADGQKFRVKLN